ncbi:type II toxin-antitoxin system RelB/DinJ family antitoxin [Providencia rettgeri]|nr:type II toxin-antitoxin system RelB/DinJ family antitoxin [Providencia rettgeri]MDK7746710.1 type II toxin-antitoxin system RelB/DinJ family antitoxin [Providencia rettgeri]MDK7759567.1 type II toxin-antitoxin system RelB/DinJ family antitoxin [Providencia rettgeri]
MSTIQIRVDEQLKRDAYQAFDKLNLSPSDALRLFLRYVAENEKLPFSEVSIVVSETDEDEDILAVVRERLKKPAKRIRVNIDDIWYCIWWACSKGMEKAWLQYPRTI